MFIVLLSHVRMRSCSECKLMYSDFFHLSVRLSVPLSHTAIALKRQSILSKFYYFTV